MIGRKIGREVWKLSSAIGRADSIEIDWRLANRPLELHLTSPVGLVLRLVEHRHEQHHLRLSRG